ncbi:hypothetical protein DL96DRAFT_1821008 [Flagelloscypha sp. PMI_526]|nr:hypothetical protein DL96DRAFT_1821008 [Flagelloscypha sp. PMI_526]
MVTTFNSLGLPTELQREVLSFCDPPTLAVACLLSRDLLDDSRDILYRAVKIDDKRAASMVANASQLISRIRYLHAIITGKEGDSASWIQLFTILKKAKVIGTLNLLPPLNRSFQPTPEIIGVLDELSGLSSIHTFMAVWPSVHPHWTFSSLALWGSRLKGLRILHASPYVERPCILKRSLDERVIYALELGQLIDPATASFQMHKVRRLAVVIGGSYFHEDKMQSILEPTVHTLEFIAFYLYGGYERGATFPEFDHPLTSLTTLAIFLTTHILITRHNLPFLQRISSSRSQPNNCQVLVGILSLWNASLEAMLIGNKNWIDVAEFYAGFQK